MLCENCVKFHASKKMFTIFSQYLSTSSRNIGNDFKQK